ncbi:hypothetical protein VRU48_12385 [Pedobacter sp. KR3-3]|uniref:Uncharacterized protein n=1 Tax=Pedobacter albus TaxID=3113905 RepID=A0ABU7I8X3_9SPHI|nr:hypothetical protein [Pedobacter sp. KR3-3]MEE1945910.1 hypothetical protein [Pedobacter sp. KR3-3]
MKNKILLCIFLLIGTRVMAQTYTVDANSPGVSLAPYDAFSFANKTVAHYGLGWYNETSTTLYGYLSGYYGLRFFTAGQPRFTVDIGGNVGIGTTNPMARLHVQADANTSGAPSNAQLFIGGATNPAMRLSLAYNTSSNYGEIQAQAYANAYVPIALNPNGGNVLIGKAAQTNTTYKLDINGKARANEIVVNTTGADFVFENNYKLRPLAEVESFVKQNKHLPEIPTAKTMQEQGVGVSELQTKLLQKVEELTLYIIQQQKEIDELKKKINK